MYRVVTIRHSLFHLSWAVSLAACETVAQSTISIPIGAPVTIDGTWSDSEWLGTTVEDSIVTIAVHVADGFVQIGLRTSPILVASLCVARSDTVDIFHASSALGRARYVMQGDEWQLIENFEWRVRTTDLGPEAVAERLDHRQRFGWIANTTRMGQPGHTEVQISTRQLHSADTRLAIGLLMDTPEGSVRSWPMQPETDGCAQRSVIAGPLPERVHFSPGEWAVLDVQSIR